MMGLMDDAQRRVSTTERQEAIAALQVHLTAGRLDSGEYEERSVEARQARTRGELESLFADLPEPGPRWDEADTISASPVSDAGAPPRPPTAPTPADTSSAPTGSAPERHGGLVPEPWAGWVMSLTPFAAVLLFFSTGHHWQWFLAIPIVAMIVYGPEGKHGRRDRDANRDYRRNR
jgi:uncharacterized protein DUF1707